MTTSAAGFFRDVDFHGDAAAVVDYGDAIVFMHEDVDLIAIAGHGFVDRIVRLPRLAWASPGMIRIERFG